MVNSTVAPSVPWIQMNASELPSRGVPYPEGSIIKYRSYTHGEVRAASVSNFDISASLDSVLSGIETQGFKKEDLTLVDVFLIGIYRKVSSLNEMRFEIPFICENCGNHGKKIFTHKDISFKDLDAEVTSLPATCEISGKEISFSPMTVGKFIEIQRGVYNKAFKDPKKPDPTAILAGMVTNMPFKEAYDFLYAIPQTDLESLEVLSEIDKLLMHDIEELEITCSAVMEDKKVCNHLNKITIAGREMLITPFRDGEGSSRARIRFGKKQDN